MIFMTLHVISYLQSEDAKMFSSQWIFQLHTGNPIRWTDKNQDVDYLKIVKFHYYNAETHKKWRQNWRVTVTKFGNM